MHEYRWLLFDRRKKESYLGDVFNRAWKHVYCYGLYKFPLGTLYPSMSFFSEDPDSAVNALRSWAEAHCVPAMDGLTRSDWEDVVRTSAYYLWVDEGRPDGRHQEHWEAAQRANNHLLVDYPVATFDEEVEDGPYEEDQDADEPGPRLEPAGEGGAGGGACLSANTLATLGRTTRRIVADAFVRSSCGHISTNACTAPETGRQEE